MQKVNIQERLLDKSQEAFIMAIEVYNKPTIRYRVEGFAFFICNAWELLLKARLIVTKGKVSIYYKDNPSRTISIEQTIRQIFTNDKDPLRINLEKIITLRNICTHFVTEEYEQIYAPLFQACVINYMNKLLEYFNIDITEKISQNFLTLSIRLEELSPEVIQARYPKEIADRLLLSLKDIRDTTAVINNQKLSITIEHQLVLTKNPKTATATFAFTRDAKSAAVIVNKPQDKHALYPFTVTDIISRVNTAIKKEALDFINPSCEIEKKSVFNKYHFGLFADFYSLKSNPDYCYTYKVGTSGNRQQKVYNQKTIDLILAEIRKAPQSVIQKLKGLREQHKTKPKLNQDR